MLCSTETGTAKGYGNDTGTGNGKIKNLRYGNGIDTAIKNIKINNILNKIQIINM